MSGFITNQTLFWRTEHNLIDQTAAPKLINLVLLMKNATCVLHDPITVHRAGIGARKRNVSKKRRQLRELFGHLPKCINLYDLFNRIGIHVGGGGHYGNCGPGCDKNAGQKNDFLQNIFFFFKSNRFDISTEQHTIPIGLKLVNM